MAKNPGAKVSKGRYLDPAAAINAGLMKRKSGEIISPGKIAAKVVSKVVGKAAAKRGAKEVAKTKKAVRYVVEKVQPKTIAENSVKVRRGNPAEAKRLNELSNKRTQDVATGKRAKSEEAPILKRNMKPAKVVKIKSGKDVKSAASSKQKLSSYTPNPGRLPNLIKIDSAKGNSVKKTAYRPNRRKSN